MAKSAAQKMMIKRGQRYLADGAPDGVVEQMGLPDLAPVSDSDKADVIHIFAITRADLQRRFDALKPRLDPAGSLWVSWPKGRGLGSDLTLATAVEVGYARGMVESTCCSLDATWSALRLTRPKAGKTYSNSHAELVLDPEDHA